MAEPDLAKETVATICRRSKIPCRFLKVLGKGFFVDKEDYALALREELKRVIKEKAFRELMKDMGPSCCRFCNNCGR